MKFSRQNLLFKFLTLFHMSLYLGFKDFSEVEDTRERERNTLPNGITRSQKKKEKKSHFYLNPIMGLLSRAEY